MNWLLPDAMKGDAPIEDHLLGVLPKVPFLDDRIGGAFTVEEMTLPNGTVKVLLAGPLASETDLLGDGPSSKRAGITIWVDRKDGVPLSVD